MEEKLIRSKNFEIKKCTHNTYTFILSQTYGFVAVLG